MIASPLFYPFLRRFKEKRWWCLSILGYRRTCDFQVIIDWGSLDSMAAAASSHFPLFKHKVKAQERQTQAKYVSSRKANWWPSISLLPSEPVNRRAAITHVLTACNGIFLGWAKGCQAARCRSEKAAQPTGSPTGSMNKENTHTHTLWSKPLDVSINYSRALRTHRLHTGGH